MSKYRYANQEVVEKHNMTSIEVKRSEYRDMLQNRVKRKHEGAEACLKMLIGGSDDWFNARENSRLAEYLFKAQHRAEHRQLSAYDNSG